MIRIGIVGCGFIGSLHGYALHVLRRGGVVDAAVTVCHDREHDRAADLAQVHEARVADDLPDLIDDVDVVWVCTWTSEHLPVVEAAVGAGRAVFCEKPLATTMADCERIADLLSEVPHQVNLPLRTAPVYVALREEVASGRYGRPMTAMLRSDQFWPVTGHYASTWREDASKTGGGALVEHSIHDVDLLRWLLGPVEEVGCRSRTFRDDGYLEDAVTAVLSFADPVVATLTSVWHRITARKSSRYLEVICEDGLLWADNDYQGPLHVHTRDGREEIATPPPAWYEEIAAAHERPLGFYAVPARRFLDHLGGAAPDQHRPGARVALEAHRIVEACYRSAAEGARPVPPG